VPRKRHGLLEFFGEDGELELGLGERLNHGGLGVFRGGVARRCHFADEEVLRSFEHFLLAEGERLAAAEGNETLEDDGDFEEGPGAHAFGVLFEAVLPVVVRVKFAFFEEAQDLGGFRRTNNGTKANGHRVGLRNHDAQAAGNNANHEVTFGSTVQDSIADLLNNAHTVIRVNDLVADLVVHRFGCPPPETHKEYITIVLEESRYIQWNQEVRENWVRIWQSNCLGRRGLWAPCDGNKEQFNAGNGRSLIQILFWSDGNDMP
jgi:hypothetical protein